MSLNVCVHKTSNDPTWHGQPAKQNFRRASGSCPFHPLHTCNSNLPSNYLFCEMKKVLSVNH